MANRRYQQFLFSLDPMLTSIQGTVSIASSTTGVTAQAMNGATAARTGVGTITITLADGYNAFLGAQFTVQSASAQDLVPQIASVDVVSAKTVVVKLLTAAAPADPASAIVLNVHIMVRNSSVSK